MERVFYNKHSVHGNCLPLFFTTITRKRLQFYLILGLVITLLSALLPLYSQGQFIPLLFPNSPQLITAQRFIPNQAILFFEPGTTLLQIASLYSLYGLRQISASPISGARIVLTPPLINLQELIVFLNMEPIILLAEPNFIGQVSLIPNDPYYRYQWHLRAINLENAWNLSTGAGVVVAILDTGVAFENFDIYAKAPDLSGTRFIAGWDFVNDDANPDDDNGHGTHITGTVAQTTNNLYGCAGVAFNATIMPVKVMDSSGNGGLADIVDGIYFAVNNGAKVINMSFGFGNNPTLSLETAVDYAYNNGVSMVCSAGNKGTDVPNYPASYSICISVSGVRYDLSLGDYSNYGPDIDICAPGGDLALDQNLDGILDGIMQQSHDGTNFTVFSFLLGRGTSWSAAHVSGVVALMQSLSGGIMTPAEVDLILKQTAIDLGTPGWDQYYGYGLVDAYAALLVTTQATIATAEAILSTNILISSTISSLLPLQSLGPPNTLTQPSPLINPVASINGDTATSGFSYPLFNLPFLQTQQADLPSFLTAQYLLWGANNSLIPGSIIGNSPFPSIIAYPYPLSTYLTAFLPYSNVYSLLSYFTT